jgi:hypothetical protein
MLKDLIMMKQEEEEQLFLKALQSQILPLLKSKVELQQEHLIETILSKNAI